MTSIYIFVLSSVYLVEYTLHQNLMIEIHTRNFDLHITVPSPNLAFLCRNLDYKPYSINQSMAVCGSFWQSLAVSGSLWLSLAVFDSFWQSLTAFIYELYNNSDMFLMIRQISICLQSISNK